jgi:phosphatidylserine/phosphatidylglycerophosphate/cardiolipin synthase-like enzyme
VRAVFVYFLFATSAFGEIQVFFCPSKDVPNRIETALDEAVESIDLAIYSFTDTRLMTRLIAAAKRGVSIRVMLDDARKSKFSPKLEEAGIDVRFVTNVMHHKFALFDAAEKKPLLLTGSANWSRTSFARYDDDLLRIDELGYIEAFQFEFEKLWGHSREFGRTIHRPRKFTPVEFGNELFTAANLTPSTYRGEPNYRSGKELPGVCGRRIIESIDSARSSIKIASAHFRREDIAVALQKAIARGVSVEILLDAQEYHSSRTKIKNSRHDETLAGNGAKVRYKFYSPFWDYKTALQMHCKYIVVDDAEVLTGSLNLSENSELRSFENLITLTDKKVVAAYVERFRMKWNYGAGEFAKLIKEIKTAGGAGPCSFSPISLSGKQVAELRRNYARNACRDK